MSIVYLRGSARDSRTRTARHSAFPRQSVVRIGPWVIRPARRTSVRTEQLTAHAKVLLDAVKLGLIIIERPDMSMVSISELQALLGTSAPEAQAPQAQEPVATPPEAPPLLPEAPPEDLPPEESPPEELPPEDTGAPEETAEEASETLEAPEAEQEPVSAKKPELPEGWREMTNAKLLEIIKDLGLQAPEKINKPNIIAVLEAYLEA